LVIEPECPAGCGSCSGWASGTASAAARVTFRVEQAVVAARVGAALTREPPQCFLNGECRMDGSTNADNDCQMCVVDESVYEWSSRIYERCRTCPTAATTGCTCNNIGQCLGDQVLPGAPNPPADPEDLASPRGAALPGGSELGALPNRTVSPAPRPPAPAARPALQFLSGAAAAASDLAELGDPVADFFDTSANVLSRFTAANTALKSLYTTISPFLGGNGASALSAIKFDTTGLDLDVLDVIFDAGKSIEDAKTDDGLDAGTCAFSLSGVASGFFDVVTTTIPLLSAIPSIPTPPGFPDVGALIPKGISITFDPADPTQIAGFDLSIDLPDADIIPGVLSWTSAEAAFYYSQRLLALSGQVTLGVPVIGTSLGTFDFTADVRFAPSFKGLPSAAITISAAAAANNDAVDLLPAGLLTVKVHNAALDTGARSGSVAITAECDIPLLGKVGPYTGSIELFLKRNATTASPPASDADPTENREDTIVILSVEAGEEANPVPVIPGGILSAQLESLYLHTGDSILSLQGTAAMSLPLYGSLGEYRAVLDLNFTEPNFKGDVAFELLVEAIEPAWLTVVPTMVKLKPLRAQVSSSEAFVDLRADVSITVPLLGHFGDFEARLQLIFPASPHYTGPGAPADGGGPWSGSDPDLLLTFENAVSPPTMFPLIPGVIEVGLARGAILKDDGLISLEGVVDLNLPGIADLGRYETVVELRFEPGLVGTPKLFVSFVANPETAIPIIPGFVSFTLVKGVFDQSEGKIMLKGRVELPIIGSITGVLFAEWESGEIKGLPTSVCVYPTTTPPAGDAGDTMSGAGVDSSDTEGLPLPGGLLRFHRVCVMPAEKTLRVELTGEPGRKLNLIPGFVTAYGIEFHIEMSFGRTSDKSGSSTKTVQKKRKPGEAAPSGDSSFQLSFKLLGQWTIGDIEGWLAIEKNTGEFIISGGFDRLSAASLASKFIGDLPEILELALDGFAIRDVEFAAVLSGGSAPASKNAKEGKRKRAKSKSSKTRIFRIAGLPDSAFIRQFIDESAKAELLTGQLAGKPLFAFVSSIKVDRVLAFIGDRIGFPAIENLPFPGESPLRLGYANAALSYKDNPELNFGTVDDPPDLLQGVGFAMNLLKPQVSCPGACEKIMSVIEDVFNSVSVSVSVSVLKPTVRFKGALSLSIDAIVFKLEEVSLNLVIPIPALTKMSIYLEAKTEILIAFVHMVPLDFQIGYRQFKIFGSGFSDKLINLWGIPFFHIGRIFGEVELGLKTITGAVGGEILIGLDCLDERGQEKDDSGCFLARAAIVPVHLCRG
jgi:hypothetical protein